MIGLTDAGLVGGAGSTFMRMRKGVRGISELAFDQDCDRLIALMSVAANRPVAEAEVLPHVMAAAAHWQRGDKALANFRLAVAKLPNVADQTSSYRLSLAAHLLDNGWSSRGLMIELGLAPQARFEKYNPNHVSAGNGLRGGQFDFATGAHRTGPSDGRFTVAEVDDENSFEERERRGQATPKEEIEHGHAIAPTTGSPFLGGRSSAAFFDDFTLNQLNAAARAAAAEVGPGKGPVYGTAVHTEFKAQVQGLGRDDLHPEQSYLNGVRVPYGTLGSIRLDQVQPTKEGPHTVYDLKTGSAYLTGSRKEQILTHVPKRADGRDLQIHEVRP